MNFPTSPSLNQTYSLGDKTWKWNGVAWDLQSTSLTSSHVVAALGFTPLNKAGDTMTGNLAFSGTGLRITGDFSNATMLSRTLFQSSTTNGNTQVGAIPNGTAVNSAWFTYNNSDPTNASTGILRINASEVALISGITGTGTYLPLVFLTNNLERGRFDTAGNWGVGTSAPKVRAQFSAGSAQNAPTLGTAQGIAYFSNNDAAYGLLIGNSSATGAAWLQAQRTDGTATAYDLLLNPAGGNLGLGVTPSAWVSPFRAFEFSSTASLVGSAGGANLFNNAYYNGSNYIYKTTAAATRYLQGDAHYWYTAVSGTAGNAISFTQSLTLDTSSNLTAAGNVTAYSDERLKKDWSDLPSDFIERLAQVKHGTYTRTDNGQRQAGVGAQSLKPLLPEAILDGEYLSVAYGNAAMVSAVELAKRVVRLEKALADMIGD